MTEIVIFYYRVGSVFWQHIVALVIILYLLVSPPGATYLAFFEFAPGIYITYACCFVIVYRFVYSTPKMLMSLLKRPVIKLVENEIIVTGWKKYSYRISPDENFKILVKNDGKTLEITSKFKGKKRFLIREIAGTMTVVGFVNRVNDILHQEINTQH